MIYGNASNPLYMYVGKIFGTFLAPSNGGAHCMGVISSLSQQAPPPIKYHHLQHTISLKQKRDHAALCLCPKECNCLFVCCCWFFFLFCFVLFFDGVQNLVYFNYESKFGSFPQKCLIQWCWVIPLHKISSEPSRQSSIPSHQLKYDIHILSSHKKPPPGVNKT